MFYIPNYASALRCIGQALERQNIDIFELTTVADGFVIQCGEPKPPYTGIVSLRYTPHSITILDREGANRTNAVRDIAYGFNPRNRCEYVQAANTYFKPHRNTHAS